jgi:hypothetical protein
MTGKDNPFCTALVKSNEFKTVRPACFILNSLKTLSGFQVARLEGGSSPVA